MFQKINRRRFLVATSAVFALCVVAYANDKEVIHFAGNSGVVAGQSYNGQVSTNVAGMSVTFTSDPPGLVSYTAIVPGNGGFVSIPTNPNAAETLYRIVATPTGGGISKVSDPISVSPSLNL